MSFITVSTEWGEDYRGEFYSDVQAIGMITIQSVTEGLVNGIHCFGCLSPVASQHMFEKALSSTCEWLRSILQCVGIHVVVINTHSHVVPKRFVADLVKT